MNKFDKFTKNAVLCTLLVYVVALITASLISSTFGGSFMPVSIGFFMLIYSLYSLPLLFLALGGFNLCREAMRLKAFGGGTKRIKLFILSYLSLIASVVLLYLYLATVVTSVIPFVFLFTLSLIILVFCFTKRLT